MLYLVTGTPGSGKTLNTIKFVNESPQFHHHEKKLEDGTKEKVRRNIYYFNIRDLDPELGWIEINEEQAKKWYEFPSGSVFIFDEAYDIFPAKSSGAKSPEHVTKLATHRHYGMDIFLICQKSSGQVDTFVRGLINRHQHYSRVYGLATVNRYTWETCQLNTESASIKKLANISTLKMDKKYFGKYHSADEHTHTRNLPWKDFIKFGIGAIAVIGFIVWFWITFQSVLSETEDAIDGTIDGVSAAIDPDSERYSRRQTSQQTKPLEEMTFVELHTPEIEGLPWTAPIYREVTAARSWPRPGACVEFIEPDSCVCYSQQATKVPISTEMCQQIVKEGFYDWTKDDGTAHGFSSFAATSQSAGKEENRESRAILINHRPYPRMKNSGSRIE